MTKSAPYRDDVLAVIVRDRQLKEKLRRDAASKPQDTPASSDGK